MEIIQHDQVVSLKNMYPWATINAQCSIMDGGQYCEAYKKYSWC